MAISGQLLRVEFCHSFHVCINALTILSCSACPIMDANGDDAILGKNNKNAVCDWYADNRIHAEMSSSEAESVRAVASESPCFVILGQSRWLRVAIANRIFGEDLLPLPGDAAWHTVIFRYGSRNRVVPLDAAANMLHQRTAAAAGGGNSSAPAAAAAAAAARRPAHSWKASVPLCELELTADDTGGVTRHSAVEVRANHPLLHAGARIAIRGDTGNLMDIYTFCIRDAAPVVIYAIHRTGLLEEVYIMQKFFLRQKLCEFAGQSKQKMQNSQRIRVTASFLVLLDTHAQYVQWKLIVCM